MKHTTVNKTITGIVMALCIGLSSILDNSVAQQPVPSVPDTLGSLKGVPVPLPNDLDLVVKNRARAIVLGKALFWDKQAGSDGQACASCHFHAGADNRSKNQLSPGLRAVPPDMTFQHTRSGVGGVNYQLKQSDFPFHVVSDSLDRNSAIEFTTNDVSSSQGTFGGTFSDFIGRSGRESCELQTDQTFQVNGKLARRVEPRNTPTVINATFQFRTFWDGRANNRFNGVDPFGRRNAGAKILVNNGSGAVLETLDLNNAALASQAVGPPGSDLEMACAQRAFKQIGRKLLNLGLRPLFGQKVASNDSVLGPYAHPGHGLKVSVTYETLIKEAFQDKYWKAFNYVSPAGFTMMEENFSFVLGPRHYAVPIHARI